MKHIINKLSALILMLMCVSATVQAEIVYHPVCEPTYGTLGYSCPCWEDTETGKIYADKACTQEIKGLELVKTITYAKLQNNPIPEKPDDFSFVTEPLEINGENLDLNWAVSTTFKQNSKYLDSKTRSVQFKILNDVEYVSNVRIVLFSEINRDDYDIYSVSFTLKRDGHNETGQTVYGEDANGFNVFNLGWDVKKGDIVEFSVIQKYASYGSFSKKGATFKASLEYTYLKENDIEHHTTCAPTLTSRGFNLGCWENKITGQIFSDAKLRFEITDRDFAQAVTYLPLRENPVGNTSEFEKRNYDSMQDVDLYWDAYCNYDYNGFYSRPRNAEFNVTADNVSSARLVWYIQQNGFKEGSGVYEVRIYVNGIEKFYKDFASTGRYENYEGIYVLPLPELKKGDKVKFQVVQNSMALSFKGDIFRASLEYIGKFANDDYLVYHPIQEPTETSYGFTRECWEDINTAKYYTNAGCYEEITDLDLAKTVIYPKRPENPIVATNGFTQSDHESDWEVDLNWAGVTSYPGGLSSAPRWVDFKASTTTTKRIANARLVWNKNRKDPIYEGVYNIKIYVNDIEKYSRSQYRNEDLDGVFVKTLPDLKKDDIVRFEVTETYKNSYEPGSTFKASLEYNEVPCTEHEYAASSAVCSLCGYVKPHEHTYNETEICSLCGGVDPLYIVMSGNVGKVNAEDIKWELNRYNVLTYTGTGEMENFNNDHNEWRNENKNLVTKLVIGEGITKIGDSGTNGYFDQMSNLADVYLMGDQKVSAANDAFDDDVNNVTLHVDKSLLRWANATSPWNRFGTIVPLDNTNIKYIDASDNTQGVYLNPKASDNTFTLTDGCKQLAIYEDIPLQTLTYTRSFSAANTWQALYVPFEMEYNDWKDNFDVAAICNFHEYTNNGVTESIELEVRYVKSGKLRANTPYLIRAKEAGVKTIEINDATLMAPEVKSIDCSSTERRYTFTGTYDAINKLKTKDYIFMSGGRLSKANNDTDILKSMRWYLTIEDYFSVTGNASPALAKPMMIRMIDDDETTDIENISVVSSPLNAKASGIFSITGAKLTKLQRGINIVNGKKIVVK